MPEHQMELEMLTSNNKDRNVGNKSLMKCDNCNQSGYMKVRCWAKGGGQEGQILNGSKARRTNTPPKWSELSPKHQWSRLMVQQVNQMCGSQIQLQLYMSVPIGRTSPLTELTLRAETSKPSATTQ